MTAIACGFVALCALYLSWIEESPRKAALYIAVSVFAVIGATVP